MTVTPALARVLAKAAKPTGVFAAGGFSQDNPLSIEDAIDNPDFDRRHLIERLVVEGLLAYADGFNQYRITDAGIVALGKCGADKAATA